MTGEISNLVFSKTGHVYFSLKDELSTINCMIWKNNAHKLEKLNPKDGMKINVVGRVTYYVPGGRISLEVNDVQVEGIGELQVIYDQRYKELEQAGWFDQSIKKPLPKYPANIGIVTADTGAAIHDLITTITRRWPIANIFLFPSKVQGEGAAKEIKDRIIQANNFETPLDVLIVGRGGGSYEDLWQFNEMPVLEGIRNSSIPVISGVGHEPDITLADYVADKRAATPTAAGEIATPNIEELRNDIKYKFNSLTNGINQLYNNNYQKLKNNYNTIINHMTSKAEVGQIKLVQNQKDLLNNLNKIVDNDQNKIKQNILMLKMAMDNIIRNNEMKLENDIKTLNLINPEKPLEKGYALITKNGKVLEANEVINVNDNLTITRKTEVLDVKVENISKKENK